MRNFLCLVPQDHVRVSKDSSSLSLRKPGSPAMEASSKDRFHCSFRNRCFWQTVEELFCEDVEAPIVSVHLQLDFVGRPILNRAPALATINFGNTLSQTPKFCA